MKKGKKKKNYHQRTIWRGELSKKITNVHTKKEIIYEKIAEKRYTNAQPLKKEKLNNSFKISQ